MDSYLSRVSVRRWLVVAGLLYLAAWAVWASYGCPKGQARNGFDSDFLNHESFYVDVMCDGYHPGHYQFSAATFAFPELATYFPIRALAGSAAMANAPWYSILFVMLTFGGCWAVYVLVPVAGRTVAVPLILMAAASYVSLNAILGFHGEQTDFFYPLWHNGAILSTFLGIGCSCGLFRTERKTAVGWAILLAGLSVVSIFSDRLFALYFAAPFTVGFVALRIALGHPRDESRRVPVTWRRLMVWLVAVGFGCSVGLGLLRLTQGPTDPLNNYWSGVELQTLSERAIALAQIVGDELCAGNMLLIGAVAWFGMLMAAGLWRVIRRLSNRSRTVSPSFDGLLLVQVASTMALIVVTGTFLISAVVGYSLPPRDWHVFGRYFLGPIALAWLGWAVRPIAWAFSRERVFRVMVPLSVVSIGLVCTSIGTAMTDHSREGFISWYPDEIQRADEECKRRGLRYGLAGYCDARRFTLLSKADLVVRPVCSDAGAAPGLIPFTWLGNPDWFWQPRLRDRGRPLEFEFIVACETYLGATLLESDVVARFGLPAERIQLGRRVLLVYNRPTDSLLRHFPRNCDVAINDLYRQTKAESVVYPGAAFRLPEGIAVTHTPELARVVEEGQTAAGLIAYGPYLPMRRPGRYTATFRLTPEAPAGHNTYVDILMADPAAGTEVLLIEKAVSPQTTSVEVPLTFEVPTSGSRKLVQFRTHYSGRGKLILHQVSLVPES
jgi:hypothetical protein